MWAAGKGATVGSKLSFFFTSPQSAPRRAERRAPRGPERRSGPVEGASTGPEHCSGPRGIARSARAGTRCRFGDSVFFKQLYIAIL